MNAAGIQWEGKAIPSDVAVSTWTAKAPDGHELQADLYGGGSPGGDPWVIALQALDLENDHAGLNPARRWPHVEELFSILDLAAPGMVFQLLINSQPFGIARDDPPLGTPFGLKALQVSELPGMVVERGVGGRIIRG